MRLAPIFALILTAATLVSACGGDGDSSNGGVQPTGGVRLKVVTTVAPITSLVENIGGTKIDLEGVVPEGVNSHTFEPPPSTVATIEDADLIVANGLQLEGPTLALVEANKPGDATILLLGDQTLTEEEIKFSSSFPENEGKPNPHLWPDATLAYEYASLIHTQLVELDPGNEEYYNTNFAELSKRLEALDQQMGIAAQTVPEENRKLLTYHDSWAYWADTYEFSVMGAIQRPDFTEPETDEVADLVARVREENVPAVFGSEVFPSEEIETIASDAGVEYGGDLSDDDLPGGPGDADHSYLGMMVENMRVMIPALGGDAAPLGRIDTSLVFTDGPSTAEYRQ